MKCGNRDQFFTFAVIGDMHYVNQKYHLQVLGSGEASLQAVRRRAVLGYTRMNSQIFSGVFSEVRQYSPQFVIQIGDLIEGSCDNYDASKSEIAEAVDVLSSTGSPIYGIARGTHEGIRGPGAEAFEDFVVPFLSKQLKEEVRTTYYSFDYGNSHFIILDYLQFGEGNDQYLWLKKDLDACIGMKHLFIFAHGPLFPLARPFFTNKEFVDAVVPLLRDYQVDALFCGHTHNQCVSLHKVGGTKILQLKSSITGNPESRLVPLNEVSTLLLDRGDSYFWGIIEKSYPSWFLAEVIGERVRVKHYVLGREYGGCYGIIEWEKAGRVNAIQKPEPKPPTVLEIADLSKIKFAYLHLSLYGSQNPYKPIFLNGKKICYAPVSDSYVPKTVEISKDKFSVIKIRNTVEIENPDEKNLCVGRISLEVVLEDDRICRSNVSPHIYVSSRKWDAWNIRILRHFEPGKKISPIVLRFTSKATETA